MRCLYCVGVRKTGIGCTYRIFPRIIAGGDYFIFFRTKRGRLFEGERLLLLKEGDYFKYCSLEVVP